MSDLLITNATLVNEGLIRHADVYIKNGRIEQIGAHLGHLQAAQTIDATGKIMIPGMIDDQVHFREPGFTHKGDIQSESRAAVAGGITSYMEMPNCNPLTITPQALADKYVIAAEKSLANHAFYFGASNDNIEHIKALDPLSTCGIKVFMGASTGNMLVDNPETLEQIFQYSPVLIATHCESTPIIEANEIRYKKQYGNDVPLECHPLIRSEEACFVSSSLAVSLAKKYNSRLHILHLTTAKELAHFNSGPVADKQITAEACVHHLFYNESDYAAKGNLIKCNPAIKSKSDQDALIQAVIDNKIDIIATDHAPHTLEEKQQPYLKAPAGLPLVQYALPSLLEHYHRGVFTLELIVEKVCHAPATRFQLKERGFIREGYWADLTLINLNKPKIVKDKNILSKCGWSPFKGYRFRSRIDTTIVNGNIVYQNGEVSDGFRGLPLTFNR
ncbi:MAG: dihydroorotase [Gammaproteobacteria bacterium]|nr:dihydroorotase [Gammaproteobacteria bacterium]